MRVLIAIFALLAIAYAGQLSGDPIPIIKQSSDVGVDGSYSSSYETGNGISASESGQLKNAGNKDTEAEEVQGAYQYTAPDGQVISLQYTANENGFAPQGAHLPVPPVGPEIPEAILRALKWIEAHPDPEAKKYADAP